MVAIGPESYDNLPIENQSSYVISDHMGGFDQSLNCGVLHTLNNQRHDIRVSTQYIFDSSVKTKYTNLQLLFDYGVWSRNIHYQVFKEYTRHPRISFRNFICSFNGTAHVSRKLLVAILEKFGWANPEVVTKNFSFSADELDGHIQDYVGDRERFFRKFFITDSLSDGFFNSINSVEYQRFAHLNNVRVLDKKITSSFVHVVSETMATGYYPFVTEKFLYSVVTRGLFVAFAQPGWHEHIERYHGFRLYRNIFDYSFDSIPNPVERLVALMSMLSKFSSLTVSEWHDLYQMEMENIEHNYHHYFGGEHARLLFEHETH